jgi:DNA primase
MVSAVDQIKDRLSIVDVVGQYVKLQKAGKNYRGLSPFNKEKTPSFYVSPDKGMYYCFSSGKGGDMFTFIEEMEGVDFRGALRILAEQAGVEIVPEKKGARDARERMYDLLEEAAHFYEAQLRDNLAARAYVGERGIEEMTSRKFRLGFAPDAWDALKMHLVTKRYKEFEIEKAGLIKKGERGKYYDRFRSRIMFPIMDPAGRVVAFSGRIFRETASKESSKSDEAKYINSPESPLFDKSRILYGYDKAKGVIRKHDFSILVEGQMDLVLSHQSGFPNTVAISGTSLTEHHIGLLQRLSKNVVLALDADRAGLASAHRSSRLAMARSMEVKIVRLPEGVDPADLARESKEKWREAIRNSEYAIDFFINHFRNTVPDARKRQRTSRELILPLIRAMPSRMDQAHYAGRLARALDLPQEAVWEEVLRTGTAEGTNEQDDTEPSATSTTQGLSRRATLERTIAGIILATREDPEGASIDRDWHETEVTRILGRTVEELLDSVAHDRERILFEAETMLFELADTKSYVRDTLRDLELAVLHEALASLSEEIRLAEVQGNQQEAADLLSKFHELSVKIDALKQRSEP